MMTLSYLETPTRESDNCQEMKTGFRLYSNAKEDEKSLRRSEAIG